MTKPAITAEEPLLAEISAFLQAVRSRSVPVVSLEDRAQSAGAGPGDSGGDCPARGTDRGGGGSETELQR